MTSARQLRYQERHKDAIRARGREAARLRRADPVHREEERARGRARYAANIERERAKLRAKAAARRDRLRPDRRRASRPYRRHLTEGAREAAKQATAFEIRMRRNAAIKLGRRVARIYQEHLDARWAFYGGLCWICREPATEWDHVKPLTRGGLHLLANLRPTCRSCNARKWAHWPFPTRAAEALARIR